MDLAWFLLVWAGVGSLAYMAAAAAYHMGRQHGIDEASQIYKAEIDRLAKPGGRLDG